MLQVGTAGTSERQREALVLRYVNQFNSLSSSFFKLKLPKTHQLTHTIRTHRHFQYLNMNYQQRLQVAAKIILEHDARADDAPLNQGELGLKATLKPHQLEGVSWLIRRYKLGVNVVLGENLSLIFISLCLVALKV